MELGYPLDKKFLYLIMYKVLVDSQFRKQGCYETHLRNFCAMYLIVQDIFHNFEKLR